MVPPMSKTTQGDGNDCHKPDSRRPVSNLRKRQRIADFCDTLREITNANFGDQVTHNDDCESINYRYRADYSVWATLADIVVLQ